MKKVKWLPYGLSGAAAGMINGLFGAGGGMILVPMLITICKLEDKKAFSSAISIILPLSIVSLLVYRSQGIFPLKDAAPYLVGGLIGGFLGGFLFKKTSVNFLHKFFGIIILWGGIRLLWS